MPQSFSKVGQRDDMNSCCDHQGNIAELMIYDKELSQAQLDELWCSLSDKYALNLAGCD